MSLPRKLLASLATVVAAAGLMVFGTVGLGYFLICYPLIHLSRRLERRGQDALL